MSACLVAENMHHGSNGHCIEFVFVKNCSNSKFGLISGRFQKIRALNQIPNTGSYYKDTPQRTSPICGNSRKTICLSRYRCGMNINLGVGIDIDISVGTCIYMCVYI